MIGASCWRVSSGCRCRGSSASCISNSTEGNHRWYDLVWQYSSNRGPRVRVTDVNGFDLCSWVRIVGCCIGFGYRTIGSGGVFGPAFRPQATSCHVHIHRYLLVGGGGAEIHFLTDTVHGTGHSVVEYSASPKRTNSHRKFAAARPRVALTLVGQKRRSQNTEDEQVSSKPMPHSRNGNAPPFDSICRV